MHYCRASTQHQRVSCELAVGKVALPGVLTGRRTRTWTPVEEAAAALLRVVRVALGLAADVFVLAANASLTRQNAARTRSAAVGCCENLFI